MARPTGKSKSLARPADGQVIKSKRMPAIVEIAGRLGRMIPEEELRLMPKDLSDQIDHYIYGTPKR